MKQTHEKEPPVRVHYFWLLCGCYLFYPAFQLARRAYDGSADSWQLNAVAAAFLAGSGVYLLWRVWRDYRLLKDQRSRQSKRGKQGKR